MFIVFKLLGLDKILTEIKLFRSSIMATIADLEAKVTTLVNGVKSEQAQAAIKLQALADEIKSLKDQIAAGSPATQADLDRLATALDSITTAVANIIPDDAPAPV